MTGQPSSTDPLRVLVVGAGVAGLEAALALREMAGGLVSTTLLDPEREFAYLPMAVLEPFSRGCARRYSLASIAADIGAELVSDRFRWLDADARVVHTRAGETLGYDALLLALGTRSRPRFRHARTLDSRHLDEQLHGLIQDVQDGYVGRLAFLVPSPMPWPLPIYELALMTARRAREHGRDVSLMLATCEESPLSIFGDAASQAVERLLTGEGISTVTSAQCEVPEPGRVSVHVPQRPGQELTVNVESVVALPQLFGPSTPGLPKSAPDGFISVDEYARVLGLPDVFAAGDATDFAIKHGGIAAQQADVAARSIASMAGAPVRPAKFEPWLSAVLLGGEKPLRLSARVTGGRGSSSEVSEVAGSGLPAKIGARYLAPYLGSLDRVSSGVA